VSMPTEVDQEARGFWYDHAIGDPLGAVDVLHALQGFRAAEQAMRRRTTTAMAMNETDLLAVRYLIESRRLERVVTAKDLAHHLEISSASTTVLIDRLVRRGHAERSPHAEDRRAVVVEATPSAEREVRERLGGLHVEMLEVAQSLTPADARIVHDFLTRIRAVVDGVEAN
jgi:DNA-binding MarR family transcriptional regulator